MPEFYRKCQTLRILIRFFTEMCNKGLNITDYTYDTMYITCAQYENLLINIKYESQPSAYTNSFPVFPIVTIKL